MKANELEKSLNDLMPLVTWRVSDTTNISISAKIEVGGNTFEFFRVFSHEEVEGMQEAGFFSSYVTKMVSQQFAESMRLWRP